MPFAIELALDPAAGATVRRIWRELDDVGITSMARSGAHPHISLGIWEALDLPACQAELAAFAREIEPVPVTLAIARRAPLPLGSRLERIGIVEFRPVRQRCAFDLGVRAG